MTWFDGVTERIGRWWARNSVVASRFVEPPPNIFTIEAALDTLDRSRRKLLCTPYSVGALSFLQLAGAEGERIAERYIYTH